MKTFNLSMLVAFALMVGITSCKKDNILPDTKPTPSVAKTITLKTKFDRFSPFVFFNFKDGEIVVSSDSATTKWDIGFRYVDIIVNSHSSGPGNEGVITEMVNMSKGISFDSLKEAPLTGYAYDTSATQRAINTNLTTGWYNYDRNTHAFSPKADRFFVFKTTDNKYVKMEILKVEYDDFVGATPVTLVYTFRYNYQPDGTRNF